MYVEKVSCSNSSSDGKVISLMDTGHFNCDTFQDLCAGTFMKIEEAREEGESWVVAQPEESEEEKFRSRYIWSTSIFPKCTAPSGVVDRIAELAGQGVKLFIKIRDKLWKHLRVHQDLAVGQHLLPLWLQGPLLPI